MHLSDTRTSLYHQLLTHTHSPTHTHTHTYIHTHTHTHTQTVNVKWKAVNLWNNGDVLKWLSTIELGSKRAECIKVFTDEVVTGEDLVDAANKGKDAFVSEMKDEYGIVRRIGRRMFKSLRDIGLNKAIVLKSIRKADSKTGVCVCVCACVCVCVYSLYVGVHSWIVEQCMVKLMFCSFRYRNQRAFRAVGYSRNEAHASSAFDYS